jgi:uncharacterized protein (TIRG00374 family)
MATAEQKRGRHASFHAHDDRPAHELTDNEGGPEQPVEAAPESVGKRLLRPQTIVSFAVAIGIVAFLVTRLDISLSAVWANVRQANLLLFGLGFALYYGTFVLRAFRWRWMLRQAGISEEAGYPIPAIPRLMDIILLSWFVNCIIPAKLGDGYRCYLFKRDTGASFSGTLGTILAERLVDLIILFVTMSLAGVVAFKGNLPSQVTQTMLIGTVLIGVGIVALVVIGFGRDRVQRFVPSRFHSHFDQLHSSIFACLRRPFVPTLISLAMWCTDGLRLFVVAASLGAGLSFPLAVFVALMSALLTTLPITPAGLGVVEAAIIVVLKLVDISPDMASSVALMDRLIGYWSLILVGVVLYIRRLKTEVRLTEARASEATAKSLGA